MAPATFLGTYSDKIIPGSPALLGCPMDFTSTFRSGSGASTNAIREASDSIETYSPYFDADLIDYQFSDLGDLDFSQDTVKSGLKRIESAVAEIIDATAFPFLFGGEHTITLGAIRALAAKYPDLKLIQLDAHTDLREEYEGERLNHSTVIRRISEIIGPTNIVQLGIRSGLKEEFQWMKEHQTLLQWTPGSENLLFKRLGDAPVYLTVDLDVMDPACLSGTGNPEAGGWFFEDMVRFLKCVPHINVIGIDALELNPTLDQSGAGSILAAKIIRELLLGTMIGK